jgi:MFS family permease
MNSKTLRLVLLVSCCHALVHIYELSFASVEQLVAEGYGVGTDVTGTLGTTLRMPFGLGAMFAGWLAGHFGAKRLLLVYLGGCSAAACLAAVVPNLAGMFLAMFLLGSFASIYHPAGLGLIAHHTTAENRPMALGYHGILGSAGIAVAPFLAAFALDSGVTWQQYYLILAVPGVVLAVLLTARLSREDSPTHAELAGKPAAEGEDGFQMGAYILLLVLAGSAGFVYHAVLNFLPRYLHAAGLDWGQTRAVAGDNYLTGMILSLGIVGQYTAGRIARPKTLEPILALVFGGVAASLFWMALAEGTWRIAAAAVFALLFFMHQPIFNSLVAKYVSRRRRSLAYGISFTMGFGFGSLGSTYAGYTDERVTYLTLGGIAVWVFLLGMVLWWWNRPPAPETPGPPAGDEPPALDETVA